jgi:hypothetical protein
MLLLLLLLRRRMMVDVERRWRRVVARQWLWVGGGWGRGRDLGEVLVVVHPHLEDAPGDADLGAEGVHGVGVGLVDAPPDAVRELAHEVLLLRRELGPETLLARRGGSGGRPSYYGHLRVGRVRVRVRRWRGRGRGAAQLLAGRLGQRGGRGRRGRRHVVRRARVHVRRGQQQRNGAGGVGAGGGGGSYRRRGRYRHAAAGDRLASVEAAVAAAGGAGQRGGPVAPGRHELAAAVEHVRAKPRRVVPQALPVPPQLGRFHHGHEAERRGCRRWRGATAENAILGWFLVVAPDMGLRSRGSVPLPLRFPRMELRMRRLLAVSRREAWWRQRWLHHQR